MWLLNLRILCVGLTILCATCVSGGIMDLFTRRLSTDARFVDQEPIEIKSTLKPRRTAINLIRGFGYPAETHEVQTEDGYLLTLHRVPHGVGTEQAQGPPGKRPVVLMFHGLLASSDYWLIRGPNQDLVYIMADSGYDVWLGNARGNVYSRKHISLDPNKDKEFWDFSFHEIGYYDVAATVDYILNTTQTKSLFYIGHSMGGTVFFILGAMRPEYNSKIKLMHGLSPATHMIHRPSPIMSLVLNNAPSLLKTCRDQNIYEVFPSTKFNGRLGRAICTQSESTKQFCLAGVFLVTGVDYQQFNMSLLPKMFDYYPAGGSLNSFDHFYQLITSKLFRQMDFGEEKNMIKYGQKEPPEYNLKNIKVPVALYYGDGDYLVKRTDTEMLASKLPNLIGVFKVPYPFFNHIDFLWGSYSKRLLYDQMLNITNKYR